MDMFASMSDLMADAEDLTHALANSANPDIEALSAGVNASIDDMKRVLRRRLKTLATKKRTSSRQALVRNAWLTAASAAIAMALLMAITKTRRARLRTSN